MYRQGDILLVETTNKPRGNVREDGVIQHGETTGHTHRLIGDGQVYTNGTIKVFTTAEVVHEEHESLILKAGTYRVLRQREYTDTGDRYVAD